MYYNPRPMRSRAVRSLGRTAYEMNSVAWPYDHLYHCTPEANVLELDDRFLLEIALPGVVLDDVEIKAEEYLIYVRAKRLPAPFEQEAFVHTQEMPFTYLVRSFEFSTPLLAEQVEARMDRGILYISLPKLEIAHRVPVSAGSIDSRLPGFKTQIIGSHESVRATKETARK